MASSSRNRKHVAWSIRCKVAVKHDQRAEPPDGKGIHSCMEVN